MCRARRWSTFTHKNFGFSDSAEAFVLISGIAVGLAYGRRFEPGNRLLQTLKMWRRAGVLYITHIMTTLVTLGIFSAAALYLARPELLKLINIEALMDNTPEALVGIVTLGHQLGYNNILPMYAALLLMVPLFLLIGSAACGDGAAVRRDLARSPASGRSRRRTTRATASGSSIRFPGSSCSSSASPA